MPTLHETQTAFSRALLTQDCADLAPFIIEGAAERLNIYRNTYKMALTNALRLCYPAVHRLVGEEFFAAVAQDFIAASPPCSASLDEYGAAFPDFLARIPSAAALPYLADVARLDWAVHRALHAADADPLGQRDLAGLAK